MWRWYLLLGLVGLLAAASAVYLLRAFHRTTPVKRLAERHKGLSWLAAAVPLGLVALVGLVNWTTMAVVVLHLVLFFLLTGLAARIVGRLRGRPVTPDAKAVAAVALTAVYLGAGVFAAFHVSETHYALTTDKPLPGGSLRIVEIADSHLGITLDGPRFAEQMRRVNDAHPDAVLVVGDFVDDDSTAEDMRVACAALGELDAPVYFSYGNHDLGYFNYRNFTAAELLGELEKNGVTVLADEALTAAGGWILVGREDRSMPRRAAAVALTEGLDASRYIVMMDHQPNDYDAEAATPADLVLSGHTHGGHIFPMGQLAVLTGVNDRRCGYERRNGTDFIVTSGISGWAIPIKTGTWSEYVVIDIEQNM